MWGDKGWPTVAMPTRGPVLTLGRAVVRVSARLIAALMPSQALELMLPAESVAAGERTSNSKARPRARSIAGMLGRDLKTGRYRRTPVQRPLPGRVTTATTRDGSVYHM